MCVPGTRRQTPAYLAYRASTSASWFFITMWRRSESFSDSSPDSWVQSVGRMENFLISSAWETEPLASVTAFWISAIRSASSVSDGDVGGLAALGGPGDDVLRVDRDQRGDERLAVADHHALADQRVQADLVLEHGRRDVLAAGGDQDLLLPAGDLDEPVDVELAQVAGVEPAVGVDRGRRGLVVLPVALHHLAALEQQLAVVRDARPSHREAAGPRCRSRMSSGRFTDTAAVVSVRP